MAVEKERVIGRLKALFPKANLTKERLNAIAERLAKKPEDGATDEAIDEVVNEFNENSIVTIEDIAREDDRQRSIQAKLDKLTNPEAGKKDNEEDLGDKKPKPEPLDDTPEWAKALIQKVDNIEKGKLTESKKQNASQLFSNSEVLKGLKPELKQRWIDRINVDSETSIEEQIEGLESEFKELVQVSADSGDYAGAPPRGAGNPTKFSEADADKIIDEIGI